MLLAHPSNGFIKVMTWESCNESQLLRSRATKRGATVSDGFLASWQVADVPAGAATPTRATFAMGGGLASLQQKNLSSVPWPGCFCKR